MQETSNKNLVVELSFQFSLKIIAYVETLEQNHKYVVAKQLLRSGTSIGANIREAQHAESRPDFIHKLKIAAKEAEETVYWLLLCKNAKGYNNDCDYLIEDCKTISRIISRIITSTKQNIVRKS